MNALAKLGVTGNLLSGDRAWGVEYRFNDTELFIEFGLLVPVMIKNLETGARAACLALADTGANTSIVCTSVVQQLELKTIGIAIEETWGERRPLSAYRVGFGLAHSPATVTTPVGEKPDLPVGTVDGELFYVHALLGRDLLQHCQMIYDGPARKLTLTWAAPP